MKAVGAKRRGVPRFTLMPVSDREPTLPQLACPWPAGCYQAVAAFCHSKIEKQVLG